jgi:hypothetical protein
MTSKVLAAAVAQDFHARMHRPAKNLMKRDVIAAC